MQKEMGGPVVDVEFGIQGLSGLGGPAAVPADHGYALFAAVIRRLPWVHGDQRVGIHPLRGQLGGQRTLLLTERARLVFRLPVERVPALLPLAGQALDLQGSRLQVGTPQVRALMPADRLYSRLAVIKGMLDPQSFVEAAKAQLAAAGARGEVRLVPRQAACALEIERVGGRGEWVRRTLRIKDKEIVGYAVEVEGLSPGESVALQAAGLGGRRRFGCGLLVPAQRARP